MCNNASALSKSDIFEKFPDIAKRFALKGRGPIGEPSGFGAVWKARDKWLGRDVAIKISDDDLIAEIVLCRDIEGQTVRIFDCYRSEDGWHAYVMELLEKPWLTLSKFIAEHKYKGYDLQHYFDCFEITYQILLGLKGIHGQPYSRQRRYVHADIKPGNLFLRCQPKKHRNTVFRMRAENEMLRIIDLGIAVPRGELISRGTPAYDYPKKLEARLGHDLYSVGITFLELLTGEIPDHEVMKHRKRIASFIAERSSGSVFIDQVATDFVVNCARAVSKSIISVRSLLKQLDDSLFDVNSLYWLVLRLINKGVEQPMKKAELAEWLFPQLMSYFGWRNRTADRIAVLEALVTDLYKQKMLVRDGHRYFIRHC